jgi:hypothetical protein
MTLRKDEGKADGQECERTPFGAEQSAVARWEVRERAAISRFPRERKDGRPSFSGHACAIEYVPRRTISGHAFCDIIAQRKKVHVDPFPAMPERCGHHPPARHRQGGFFAKRCPKRRGSQPTEGGGRSAGRHHAGRRSRRRPTGHRSNDLSHLCEWSNPLAMCSDTVHSRCLKHKGGHGHGCKQVAYASRRLRRLPDVRPARAL